MIPPENFNLNSYDWSDRERASGKEKFTKGLVIIYVEREREGSWLVG